jgi:hypothetical protein
VHAHVLIGKETEDEGSAVVGVSSGAEQLGRLRFDKRTGEAETLGHVRPRCARCLAGAAAKLRRHWQAGELPDRTSAVWW